MSSEKIFKRYAELKNLIAELEDEKDGLQALVLEEMDDLNEKNKLTPFGTFQITERTTFEYSAKVKVLEEKVKTAKKQEELNKIAMIKNVSRSLRFVGTKNEQSKVVHQEVQKSLATN